MTKLEQLQRTLDKLMRGKYSDQERNTLSFADANGVPVKLGAADAVDRLKARIEQERGEL